MAEIPTYAEASRLLTQLRTLARQMPGTLDPQGIASGLLEELMSRLPIDRAAVFTAAGGGRLEVLAQHARDGANRLAWETSIESDTPLAEVWATQQPRLVSHSLVREWTAETRSAILPLVTGVRTVGIVVAEVGDSTQGTHTLLMDAQAICAPAALRLETALLFDDVRRIATNEERQRLAREIHDGIAQELVIVGYGLDNTLAELPEDSPAVSTLAALRGEVTRVITELRLNLFELRSDVDRHGGLGGAIAEYARTVGTSSGLKVHLSLDESTARLPAAVEAELLRIAQEAMTNARKHSGAHNLWISCEVNPPHASLSIADDGRGISGRYQSGETSVQGRTGGTNTSYGLSIMAERAERIRARLEITPREPRGTVVNVELGAPR